jgi:hypothetical protein
MRDAKTWGSSNRLRLGLLLIFTALFFFPASTLRAQETSATRAVRLSSVEGDVQVRLPGEQVGQKATANSQLQQGVTLTTGIGLAEIDFEDGATAYVGDNATLELTELSFSPGAPGGRITRITLTQGIVRFDANTRGVDTFAVLASGVTVSPQQLADFRLELGPDGTIVRVLQGDVLVTGANTNWTLRRGQTWSMAPGTIEGKITEAPQPSGYGYSLPLWTTTVPPNSYWLKTPPYSAPIPAAAPPLYLPGGARIPHVPAAGRSPRSPGQTVPSPNR